MPDISMCFGKYCPRKDKCYRAMAKPDRVQTYGDFETDCKLHEYRNQMKLENDSTYVDHMADTLVRC